MYKENTSRLIIVRRLNKQSRIIEKDILGQLAYRNIVKIKQAFIADGFIYIRLKYYQFTLKEVILVYINLEKC
ncbi:hypothetical protein V2W45_1242578 [Cenococcum geophilum]